MSGEGRLRAAVDALVAGAGRRRVRLVVIGAVLAVVVAWYLGMDIWHALTVGAGLGALGLCWITLPGSRKTEWPLDTGRVAEGARREVSQLSWSLPAHGRAQHTGLRRVQELGRRRLALHGLELNDPADGAAIRRLIGSSAYATLRPVATRKLPTVRTVVHCLDMLDRLDPQRSATAFTAPRAGRSRTTDSSLLALLGKRTRHDR